MTTQIENYITENLTDRAQQTALEFTNYLLRLKTPMNRKIFGRYGLTTAKHTKLLMWKKR